MTPSVILSTREISASVAGASGEEQQVVDAFALVVDLVGELAAAPRLVAVPGAAVALDRSRDARDDLLAAFLGELGVEHEQRSRIRS